MHTYKRNVSTEGLLSMNNTDSGHSMSTTSDEQHQRSNRCAHLSDYNKIAHQGGHKDLLKIEDNDGNAATTPSKNLHSTRTCGDWYKQNGKMKESPSGLVNTSTDSAHSITTTAGELHRSPSEYYKIAMQGGHKDLLKIEDNEGNVATTPSKNMHSARTCGDWYKSGESNSNNNNQSPNAKAQVRDQRRSSGNCIVPEEGPEEVPRYGKKRFDGTARRQEAPFATNF